MINIERGARTRSRATLATSCRRSAIKPVVKVKLTAQYMVNQHNLTHSWLSGFIRQTLRHETGSQTEAQPGVSQWSPQATSLDLQGLKCLTVKFWKAAKKTFYPFTAESLHRVKIEMLGSDAFIFIVRRQSEALHLVISWPITKR